MAVSEMIGLKLLCDSLAQQRFVGKFPRPVNYHPRSDRHSNIGSAAMAIDLLLRSDALMRDVRDGSVVMGVNASLRDHRTGRQKKLDLVIGRPPASGAGIAKGKIGTLQEYLCEHEVVLDDITRPIVESLPEFSTGEISQVRIAIESKACMTAHIKARPRLYDELTSSHATVHGYSSRALSVGMVLVNTSPTFMSPTMNSGLGPHDEPTMEKHSQPEAARSVFEKLSELQIRGGSTSEAGFDGLAVVPVSTDNNGSGFCLSSLVIDPRLQARFSYESMIDRIAALYDQMYGGL